jgi:hypothetical protein
VTLRCASFNVLADSYLRLANYDHVAPELLAPGARLPYILTCIRSLDADVIGLQEATDDLIKAIERANEWQIFSSPKAAPKPDGCLLLVRRSIKVTDFQAYHYADGSGHVVQLVTIMGVRFANSHIKWAKAGPRHIGVSQTKELLQHLGVGPAVIFADCNDRPGGPVRQLVEQAGFTNTSGDTPTAFVDGAPVALDLVAVRGLTARPVNTGLSANGIPTMACASDHLPVVADIDVN